VSSPDERRRMRLEAERGLLAKAFPAAELDIDAGVVILRGHRLPEGWSHKETDVLVEIPGQYPSTPPDNIYARGDLALADGGGPGNNQGYREVAGRRWLQLSYHIEGGDWQASEDLRKSTTLIDFLHGALSRFEEAS
jgi:hypothetical protein